MKSPPMHQTRSSDGGIFIMYGRNPQPGDDFVGYNFFEEPHGFTAEQGFGYLEIEFGERLGPEGRYEVLRKLGWSIRSTTWLAKDTLTGRFVAIKALSQYATQSEKAGLSSERDVLRKISSCGEGFRETHCLSLLDEFTQPSKADQGEEHICLVIDPLGSFSIPARAPWKIDTLPLVKKLLVHTLKGIHHLHSLGIVHTGIHPSNILTDLGSGPLSLNIEAFLKLRSPEKYPPEETWGGKYVQVAKSQPFPPPPFEVVMSRSHILSGFGAAQFLDKKTESVSTHISFEPPEVLLKLPWDEKIDIWDFGCLTFASINKQMLFKTLELDLPLDVAMMYQILVLTGERVPAETIRNSSAARKLLDPETGWLIDDPPRVDLDLYQINKIIGVLKSVTDLDGATALMKKCIRLNPEDRPSAKELLQDSWLNSNSGV
ncbi:hypothetical protein ACEPAG_4058 [Sanghuangporus baumii]